MKAFEYLFTFLCVIGIYSFRKYFSKNLNMKIAPESIYFSPESISIYFSIYISDKSQNRSRYIAHMFTSVVT